MSKDQAFNIAIEALYNSKKHMEFVNPTGYKLSGNWHIVNSAIQKIEQILNEEQTNHETISNNTKD
jgi:hypothetical protein